MKKLILVFAAFAAVMMSCQKEMVNIIDDNQPKETITKVFSVNSPETKTTIDGKTVKWATGDVIKVLAVESNTLYDFELFEGAGTGSAKFKCDTYDASDPSTSFYAVYPNYSFSVTGTTLKLADGVLPTTQNAVEGGVDTRSAILLGYVSGGDAFTFSHGMAYIKFVVGDDDVTSIKFSTSNSRFHATKVSYAMPSPTYSGMSLSGTTSTDITIAPTSGTFTKGKAYYVAVTTKNSNVKVFTVTCTYSDSSVKSISNSSAFNSVKFDLGNVYKIGTISCASKLILNKTSVAGIPAAAASGSTISDAYSLQNCSDADIVVSCDGTVVTSASINSGTITFNITENTAATARDGWIGLKLGSGDVQKITVTQIGTAKETYSWDFSTSGWQSALSAAAPTYEDNNGIWTVSYDGLTYTSGDGNGKWNSSGYIQPNGAGSTTKRVFSFTVAKAGTLKVTVVNPKNTETTESNRKVTVKVGSADAVNSDPVLYGSTEERSFTISAGNVLVYPTGNGLRFYKIEFESN